MWQTDADLQLFGIKHLRQILYLEPCPVEEIISSEIVPRFVEFLHLNDHQELQFEAVSCFAIISSERPKVIDLYNILPVLVSLVSSPCAKISNEAIYTLGNVAGNHLNWNCSGAFDAVVARLNALLGQEEPFMLKVCSWTLANFCKGVLTSDQRAEAITIFKQLLNEQDYVVVTFACWAVSDISNGQVHSLIENGIGSQLADLLKNNYRNYTPSVLIPMLLTLLNILKEDDSEFLTSPKIMSDILMYVLSRNNHKGLHNIIYKIISDLAVTSEILIQCMLDSKIIDALLYYLDLVAERNTEAWNAAKVPKKVFVIRVDDIKEGEDDETDEAALALAHLISNVRFDLVRELVERGCIKQLCYLLSKKNPRQHPGVVAACLDGILNMLNVAKSFDKSFVIEAFEDDDYSSSIMDLAMEECNCVIVEGITTKATTIFNMLP
ncbi:importin subunit alpha isoform X2 [Daucus carota subsp. sativus]|nr:PREDICTED: importin subunit alpha-like isoform X2 [Daucus carota subsp. sativus]